MPDQSGSPWWRPSSLRDIDDTPVRVLELYDAFRSGLTVRSSPWGWWTTSSAGPYDPRATRAHLYRVTWDDPHAGPAKCGYEPPDAEWERQPPEPAAACRDCSGEREQRQPQGSIGGIDLATRQPVEDA
ncbi:MAG: hypothetical protein KF809_17320 [Chloroflexi bacterium]|nr:hypothetical protein [Chloroflexota bacterium]